MCDLPYRDDAPALKRRTILRRLLTAETTVVVVFAAILVHVFLGSIAGWRLRHTCVVCRLERIDFHWELRKATTEINETACSRWYSTNVEPNHDHDWSPSATTVWFNYYGQACGAGDNDECRGRAIRRLTPDDQIAVYQHFDDPFEAKALFVSLTDKSLFKDRFDFAIAESLRTWVQSGCVGRWHVPKKE